MVKSSEESQFVKFIIPLLVGAVSGCSVVFFTNPIDLAKTRLQLQGELQRKGQYNKQLNGIVDTLIKTAKNEGIFSLQKGLAPAFVFQIVMNGIRLGMYDNLKKWGAKKVRPQYRYGTDVLSSGFVGFVGGYIANPFNMIKTRIMLQSSFLNNGDRYQYTGFLDAIKTIYSKEGSKGLFLGSKIWGIRTCMGAAIQLPAFDQGKILFHDKMGIAGMPGLMLASGSSTLLLCVLMCPFDVLATRYCSQNFDDRGLGIVYRNIFQGARDMVAIEGYPGFYKGFLAFFTRLAPHSFLSLILFTHIMQQINN